MSRFGATSEVVNHLDSPCCAPFEDEASLDFREVLCFMKYGIFHNGTDEPYRTIEGDWMMQTGEYVQIFKGGKGDGEIIAAIRLNPGQSVQTLDSAVQKPEKSRSAQPSRKFQGGGEWS